MKIVIELTRIFLIELNTINTINIIFFCVLISNFISICNVMRTKLCYCNKSTLFIQPEESKLSQSLTRWKELRIDNRCS